MVVGRLGSWDICDDRRAVTKFFHQSSKVQSRGNGSSGDVPSFSELSEFRYNTLTAVYDEPRKVSTTKLSSICSTVLINFETTQTDRHRATADRLPR